MLESGHSTDEVLIFNLFVILVHKDGYYVCVGVVSFLAAAAVQTLFIKIQITAVGCLL